MKNEEKASKIAKQHKLNYTVRYNGITHTDSSEAECYNSAMEMAQWKEQQMISQMKEFIAEYFYEHPHTSWLICSDEFQDLDDCFERLERYLKED